MTIETTIETAPLSTYPSVFDAGLPSVDYLHLHDPFEAHRIIATAREQAPIAMGPHAPEVLSYELVRTVLRDPRFVTASGAGLDLQGITSGPLWDRAITSILSLDGDAHHRLRRLVSKAFAPRGAERLRALAVEVITELVDPLTPVGRCDVVSDIARRYPIPVICALLGAPRDDWPLFSAWADDIKRLLDWNVAQDCLGAHLARLEFTEALRIITQRMPNPRRTQPAHWKAMTGIIGPISVPLEFDTQAVDQ